MAINIKNMFYYIQNNENNVIKDFLKNNIDIKDPEGRTALINAAFSNNLELLKWLIENNAKIDTQDNNGYTALHFACQEGNLECVKTLVENNININMVHGIFFEVRISW
jgi:ankyrin repeat protein